MSKSRDRKINNLQLEYWIDDNWHIGRLKEVPGVFSQGETLEDGRKHKRCLFSP
jgi:hypothetical protein